MPVLILGGTTEASRLAQELHGKQSFILSLAGRTKAPVQPVPFRLGGFGGIDGLRAFLRAENITHVVDATHPFAAKMSRHAAAACKAENIPLIQLSRPGWARQAGDLWQDVGTVAEAVAALPITPSRIFLTHGRLDLAEFVKAPQHFYLIRTIDPPEGLQGLNHQLILERGPFSEADEIALMRAQNIDVLVTKNSGGTATYGKIAAARALKIPVIMLRRPVPENCVQAASVTEVLQWLNQTPHPEGFSVRKSVGSGASLLPKAR